MESIGKLNNRVSEKELQCGHGSRHSISRNQAPETLQYYFSACFRCVHFNFHWLWSSHSLWIWGKHKLRFTIITVTFCVCKTVSLFYMSVFLLLFRSSSARTCSMNGSKDIVSSFSRYEVRTPWPITAGLNVLNNNNNNNNLATTPS
jgi:hypothetical protein